MKYQNCEECQINGTCNLIRQNIEYRCTLNEEFAPKYAVVVHTDNLTFATVDDKDVDYTKYEGYNADD